MNKIRKYSELIVVAVVASMVSATAVHAEDYAPGFRWNRAMDWVPGTIPGSTAGNPSPDKNGNPVWFYGYTSGGELGSENPWYAQKLSPMVWDDEWGIPELGRAGVPTWARGYNGPHANNIGTNPPINRWEMAHDLTEHVLSSAFMPVAEWRNPVGDGAVVNAGGSLKVTWDGEFADNAPDGLLDIAVARMDASTGSADLLYSATLTNPSEGNGLPTMSPDAPPATITKSWNVSGLRLDEGDTLRFTLRMRGEETGPDFWAQLADNTDITLVSTVPEPEQYVLLALGLGVLAVRLRRRV